MKGASLFCSAGVAETYFNDCDIDIVVASELLPKRCQIHDWLYPSCKTICGDITDPKVFDSVKTEIIKNGCKFLIATPPCQGMSSMGKKDYVADERNYLVFSAFRMMDECDFDYVLIENVPKFLELYFPYNGRVCRLIEIVNEKYGTAYNIESFVLNAKDYGVPQSRPRGFIKIWKKGLEWANPSPQPEITLREAIGHLPSLEAGDDSGIKWHKAKPLNERYILAMKHTPEGRSAFQNEVYYPTTAKGTRMKGFHNTFARMSWDEPCPARCMNSGNIGSHNNAHPGRALPDGTRSDARVLTLRELFIVSSLPADWNLPDWCTDQFIREIVGEAIPPKFSQEIVKGIGKSKRNRTMINLLRTQEHRWTIDKNVNDKTLLAGFAALMSQKRSFRLDELVDDSITQGRVNSPRDSHGNLNRAGSQITTGVRLLQAKYYMLGYDVNVRHSGSKKFMPSPMLINYLESADDEVAQANNFLVNLFAIQYPNPANRTPECFEIYAGRLIVKLLLEPRIDRKLYIDEFVWFLPFIERIDAKIYEELVASIVEFRALSYEAKMELFSSVPNFEKLFANVMHEVNYYFLRLFQSMGVIDIIEDRNHNEGQLLRFLHSVTKNKRTKQLVYTYRNDAYAANKKYSGFAVLSPQVFDSALKLNAAFSAFDIPTKQTDDDIYNLQDWYTTIYEVEPLAYLNCINTKIDRKSEIQAIVTEMVRASKFGSHDGKEFENALKPFMELFEETVDVQIISGSGNTDLLCNMEEKPDGITYKMNIDAKTRGHALSEINPRRLMNHIRRHGAEFCMVIAPRFALGVKEDIRKTPIIVVKSEVLANYCFYECTQSGRDYADFSSIKQIIDNNKGKDITSHIENLTISRYAL